MAIVFKKKQNGRGSISKCDLMVSVSPYRKGDDTDCLAIRISADLLQRAGWQVGDRCVPGFDAGTWTLTRTTDDREGYRVSKSERSKTRTASVKLSLSKDEQVQLGMRRGDRHECDAKEACGQRIVAVVRS